MSEDLWMIEYEQITEDFFADLIDAEEVKLRLRRLGFDADEIANHIEGLHA